MRNRAKCALCGEVLESLAFADIVTCKCSNITIWGGASEYRSNAKDYANFLRIDDEDNEVTVKFVEKDSSSSSKEKEEKPDSKCADENKDTPEDPSYDNPLNEAIHMLEASLQSFENLPDHAKYSPVNQLDHNKLIILLLAMGKEVADLRALVNIADMEEHDKLSARVEELEKGLTNLYVIQNAFDKAVVTKIDQLATAISHLESAVQTIWPGSLPERSN